MQNQPNAIPPPHSPACPACPGSGFLFSDPTPGAGLTPGLAAPLCDDITVRCDSALSGTRPTRGLAGEGGAASLGELAAVLTVRDGDLGAEWTESAGDWGAVWTERAGDLGPELTERASGDLGPESEGDFGPGWMASAAGTAEGLSAGFSAGVSAGVSAAVSAGFSVEISREPIGSVGVGEGSGVNTTGGSTGLLSGTGDRDGGASTGLAARSGCVADTGDVLGGAIGADRGPGAGLMTRPGAGLARPPGELGVCDLCAGGMGWYRGPGEAGACWWMLCCPGVWGRAALCWGCWDCIGGGLAALGVMGRPAGFTGGPPRCGPGASRGLTGRVDRQVRGQTPWRDLSSRMQSAYSR